MQNLVGVRIADAVNGARIGQSALERTILRAQRRHKLVHCAREDIDAAAIDCIHGFTPLDDVQRGPAFAAGLGEYQRAVWEIK